MLGVGTIHQPGMNAGPKTLLVPRGFDLQTGAMFCPNPVYFNKYAFEIEMPESIAPMIPKKPWSVPHR